MISKNRDFFDLIEKNLRFSYEAGDNTLVSYPHTTGWRVRPVLIVAQINYVSTAEFYGHRPLRIEPGQTIVMPPGLAHCLTMVPPRAGYSYWSQIQCEILPGVSLFSLVEPPLVIGRGPSREIKRINRQLVEVSSAEPSLASALSRQTLGLELVSILLHDVPIRADRADLVRQSSRLTPVLAYIDENFGKPIHHGLLAQKAGLSPSRFNFLFRSAFGTAPYEYVQRLRLRKAQQLLARTDLSVAEIGQEVGHPDPYHFSRTFRRSFGVSPLQYRKQVGMSSF